MDQNLGGRHPSLGPILEYVRESGYPPSVRLCIVVEERYEFAIDRSKSLVVGDAESTILEIANYFQLESGLVRELPLRHFHGAVSRAIIHQNHLEDVVHVLSSK
jgi:hypothetical protein